LVIVREFTKSMMSYGWAMSVFGVQQMLNLFSMQPGRQGGKATDAFNNVTECTAEQLGDTMRSTFRAGDTLQRGMVNMMFGMLMPWMMGSDCGPGGRRAGEGDRGARGADDRGARPGEGRSQWSPGTHRDDRGAHEDGRNIFDRTADAAARAAAGTADYGAGAADARAGDYSRRDRVAAAAAYRGGRQPGQETWRQWRMPDRQQPPRPEQTGAPQPGSAGTDQILGPPQQGWGPMP
jgi:hypothetical protein